MIASCMQSECKWRSYKVATIRLCMDGSFLNCSIVQNGSPVEVSDDHGLLSSCAVAKQGGAACNVGIGESTPGKGEKQTARNGRNGEVFPVSIWRAFILTVDKGKHGTSSGGYPRVVLDSLARLSRRVCACPLSRQCFISVPGAFISTVDKE